MEDQRIIHIVLFQFANTVAPDDVASVCDKMLQLKNDCVLPDTGAPYIKSIIGGRDMSIESKNGGFTHGFVVEFASEEHRDYYVKEDKAHHEFMANGKRYFTSAQVVDFMPSMF